MTCSVFSAGRLGKADGPIRRRGIVSSALCEGNASDSRSVDGTVRPPATVMPSISTEPLILLPRMTVVGADRGDPREHLLQVAGDRDFLDRIADLSALDPEAAGTARVVAGHVVDALPDQLGHQQTRPQPAQHDLEVVFRRRCRSSAASGCRSRPHCRSTSCRACAPNRWRGNNRRAARPSRPCAACHARPPRRTDWSPAPRGRYGSSSTLTCGAKTRLPSASTRKDDLRYSAPPLAACTKLPSRPQASGASNSTGHWRVASLRAPSRASARRAA